MSTSRALRIAVADDEPDMRDYFRVMLPRLGHLVVAVASNGRELVEASEKHELDLIIADVRMPELDGDAAVKAICSARPIPFILVSAYSKPNSLDVCEDVEHAYLTKPVKREDLEEAISLLYPVST
ncbi:MAG: response regulator [Pirellulales bacterium]|nr:response regulator [Pirellulales bacterium]